MASPSPKLKNTPSSKLLNAYVSAVSPFVELALRSLGSNWGTVWERARLDRSIVRHTTCVELSLLRLDRLRCAELGDRRDSCHQGDSAEQYPEE